MYVPLLVLGVAKDLSHIETPCVVSSHLGPEQLDAALKGSTLVLIPAGMPRKPGRCLCITATIRTGCDERKVYVARNGV